MIYSRMESVVLRRCLSWCLFFPGSFYAIKATTQFTLNVPSKSLCLEYKISMNIMRWHNDTTAATQTTQRKRRWQRHWWWNINAFGVEFEKFLVTPTSIYTKVHLLWVYFNPHHTYGYVSTKYIICCSYQWFSNCMAC